MATHSHARSRSKGSFSIFSLDTIRSFSRAGSRQATRIPSKDELRAGTESSLSHRCDPHNQPPATPEPSFIHVPREEAAKTELPEKADNQGHKLDAEKEPQLAAQGFESIRRRASRLRPKSWFALSRPSRQAFYPRSMSTQLPKTASTSTVARSVISAPVLTSTTNVKVARTEGVHCGEILDAAFSHSNRNSQVGWVAADDDEPGRATKTQENHCVVPSTISENVARVANGVGRPNKGRIHRLRNVIRDKLRGEPHRPPSTASQQRHTAEGSDAAAPDGKHLLSRDLSRRRAETINLYKEKIKELTGSGHIRRKSVNVIKTTAEFKDDEDGDPPLLGDAIGTSTADFAAEHSDAEESPFGSLTKSFASAVDKLDFQSTLPLSMSFLRSKSSFFNAKKGDQENDSPKTAEPPVPRMPPARPPPAPPLNHPPATGAPMMPRVTGSQGGYLISQPMMPQREMYPMVNRQSPGSGQIESSRRRSGPTPVVFSNEKNGYTASAPVPGYPRGVNPLRMHPPDTFAVSPPGVTLSTPFKPVNDQGPRAGSNAQSTNPNPAVDADPDSLSLEDAPIYSPSLGDLSQYARDTPRTTNTAITWATNEQSTVPTPTHNPTKQRSLAKGQSGLLKKSRSGISLFSRAKNDDASNASKPALNERDTNQKIDNDPKLVKKSRSLHFGNFFKNNEQAGRLPSVPSSPFQPATPSPLRKVTRFSSQSTKGGSSPTTLQGRK